jgi:hypothetical protein
MRERLARRSLKHGFKQFQTFCIVPIAMLGAVAIIHVAAFASTFGYDFGAASSMCELLNIGWVVDSVKKMSYRFFVGSRHCITDYNIVILDELGTPKYNASHDESGDPMIWRDSDDDPCDVYSTEPSKGEKLCGLKSLKARENAAKYTNGLSANDMCCNCGGGVLLGNFNGTEVIDSNIDARRALADMIRKKVYSHGASHLSAEMLRDISKMVLSFFFAHGLWTLPGRVWRFLTAKELHLDAFADRVNISLNVARPDGAFAMRTVHECALGDVFPSETASAYVSRASKDSIARQMDAQQRDRNGMASAVRYDGIASVPDALGNAFLMVDRAMHKQLTDQIVNR